MFSPDSKRVVYGVRLGSKQFVVVDGKEQKQYDSFINLGCERIIFDSADNFHYLVGKGSGIYLVEEKIN